MKIEKKKFYVFDTQSDSVKVYDNLPVLTCLGATITAEGDVVYGTLDDIRRHIAIARLLPERRVCIIQRVDDDLF